MHLSTHYYALSLSRQSSRLYECFRDTLIDVHDNGFPIEASFIPRSAADDDDDQPHLRELMRAVCHRFGHYYDQEPLRLIVAAEKRVWSVFTSVIPYPNVVIGHVEGDHTATSPRDLGQIVWPVVRDAMSGLRDVALHQLAIAETMQRVASGIEVVGSHSSIEPGSTLLVEDDYHVPGTVRMIDQRPFLSRGVDVREVVDDLVDTIIERVMKVGGSVVFMNPGSMKKHEGIALVSVNTGGVRR